MMIRKATLDDFEALKELKILSKEAELQYSETLKPIEETKERYLSYMRRDLTFEHRAIFIAEEKGGIIGSCLVKHFKPLLISKYQKKGYISNVYVLEDYRRKGIAQKLISRAEEWLKENGVHHLALEIHIDNLPAINLYHKNGFKDYTVKMNKKI